MTNPVIERNGVAKTLTEQVFGKKSPNKGTKFYAPAISADTLESDLKWVGLDNVIGSMNKVLRSIFADIYTDNVREDGSFNEDNWRLDAADFTSGVAKLADIEDSLDELQALQQSYALDDNFGATDEQGVKTERAVELETLIKQAAEKIKPLRIQKAAIEATYKERADKRAARKAAEAAKAQTAAVAA